VIEIKRKLLTIFFYAIRTILWTVASIMMLIGLSTYASDPPKKNVDFSLIIWQNSPVDPALVSKSGQGIHVEKGILSKTRLILKLIRSEKHPTP